MTVPLSIIFAGSGEFGAPTLRALNQAGHRIIQVITQPDRPAGRGKKLTQTPIAQLAEELRLPLIRSGDINAEKLPPADAMVVIAFGQKIGESAVYHPRLGSVNLHASLLPKYRGAAPINWAILNGEETAGNSIIRLAQKMDAGAILGQSELTIGASETAGELHDRLAEDGAPLMQKVLDQLAGGTNTSKEQDHSLVTLAPKLSRETAQLDWNQSAHSLARRINGLSPWPGCRVRLLEADGSEAGRFTLLRAIDLDLPDSGRPGTLTVAGTVTAGGGRSVEILDLQPEGKRRMLLPDFRRGNKWLGGMRLESI